MIFLPLLVVLQPSAPAQFDQVPFDVGGQPYAIESGRFGPSPGDGLAIVVRRDPSQEFPFGVTLFGTVAHAAGQLRMTYREMPDWQPYSGMLRSGDFNDDGVTDLALDAKAQDFSYSRGVYLGQGNLSFKFNGNVTDLGGNVRDFEFTDLDGDGVLDAVVHVDDFGTNFLDCSYADPDRLFAGWSSMSTWVAASEHAFTYDIDFAYLTPDDRNWSLSATTQGLFRIPIPTPLGWGDGEQILEDACVRIHSADFDGLNGVDLVVSARDADEVIVLLNDGTGDFLPPARYATGKAPGALATADWNGDGFPDLAVCNSEDESVSVFSSDGQGGFAPPEVFVVGPDPHDLAGGTSTRTAWSTWPSRCATGASSSF